LGLQSLVVKELRAIGRRHDPAVAAAAVDRLRQAGITNVSLDLIAGIPHQTAQSWEQTLDALLALRPQHVSVYMLEVDEDSRLGSELLRGGSRYAAAAVPSEEQTVQFYTRACRRLEQAGLLHYEISNFALPGWESRHNNKYWTGEPYFGFGVDAHSHDGRRRWANVDSLESYLQRMEAGHSPVASWRALAPAERLEERFFLGLRRSEGVVPAHLSPEFGQPALLEMERRMAPFRDAGWIETHGDAVRLTHQGRLFSNEVFAGLLG
jgi:oxygen-independent coproporphyrinogen-3 oxidase